MGSVFFPRNRIAAAVAAVALSASALLAAAPAHAILPPDTPDELARMAHGAVIGVITKTSWTGPAVPTTAPHEDGWVGPAADVQAQTVQIKVTEVIRWVPTSAKVPVPKVGSTITFTKPVRPYSLKVGTKPIVVLFNLCAKRPVAVGRYGTAFSNPDELRAAFDMTPVQPCSTK